MVIFTVAWKITGTTVESIDFTSWEGLEDKNQ